LNPDIDEKLLEIFLTKFQSAQQMKDWVLTFFDIDLPMGHINPESNSSPVEAMYEAYRNYRDDLYQEVPGYIWMAHRAGGKTIVGSILNLILMLHFEAQIVHLAAVKKQSEKSLEYCNTFLRKIKPYIVASGMEIITESKSKIQILNKNGSISFIDIIVANLAGGNSSHAPVLTIDELETLSPQGVVGYNEAKLIPVRYKGKGPITIKFSTRKFAFGVFEQEIQNIVNTGEKLLQWNIFDTTEHCVESRHLPNEEKEERYIAQELPLRNISPKEYDKLSDKDKLGFSSIVAHQGCKSCPLLQECKMKLSQRPKTDTGGLYNTIDFTIRQFKSISNELATAQLLCRKATSQGLVYPRFTNEGNSISMFDAYNVLTGEKDVNLTIEKFAHYLRNQGVRFYCGVDWGFSHPFAIIVSCLINNEWWLVDHHSVSGLQFDQQLDLAKRVRDLYQPVKWYADTAEPMFIKDFNNAGMNCADFKKDVWGGIEKVRTQIMSADAQRRMKVIVHERTEYLIKAIKLHAFVLGTDGNPTMEPDDAPGIADSADCLRYIAQNLFKSDGKFYYAMDNLLTKGALQKEEYVEKVQQQSNKWLQDEIARNIQTAGGENSVSKSKTGNVFWKI
jgi:hypothetical protein